MIPTKIKMIHEDLNYCMCNKRERYKTKEKMKDLLIIAHFVFLKNEGGNNRFNYIAKKASSYENVSIELITSSFFHSGKRQRGIRKLEEDGYKTTLLYEPSYKRNVSLQRVYSHYTLSKNLKKYLHSRKKPDCIYCAVPSLGVAYVASQYAMKNKIKFIIDVQDLWPEAFEMIFKVPILKNIIFYPMKRKADRIYASADEIVAVSETYKERAIQSNHMLSTGHSVYLGTDLNKFDAFKNKNGRLKKDKNEIWIVYIGTLGHSYDLISILKALEQLKKYDNYKNIKLIVMGEGPLMKKFQKYARSKNLQVYFKGRVEYAKMVAILTNCDIAVNPIIHGAAQSIINKVGDYAAAGLPVINTQECLEYRQLIEHYQCGINCENGNIKDIAKAIYRLCENKNLRLKQGKNSRKLAKERFDRNVTYNEIVDLMIK